MSLEGLRDDDPSGAFKGGGLQIPSGTLVDLGHCKGSQ